MAGVVVGAEQLGGEHADAEDQRDRGDGADETW
jgi:hypothetical protein